MAALLPILAAAALYGVSTRNQDVQYTKATVDGRSYLVLKRKDARDAANLLAMVRRDLESLVAHVAKQSPDDSDFARLAKKFNPEAVSEGSPGSGYTSYTIDKASVVLCIRQSSGDFVPKNVIMYVAIHELAHIMTSTVGHTPEFWANNTRLLDAAKQIGIYEPQDFSKTPQPYCGMHIGSSA
jgi:hypothetical protein